MKPSIIPSFLLILQQVHKHKRSSVYVHVKTKYGIKTRGATDFLDRQLKEEWRRSINTQHHLLEVFWDDFKNNI